MADKNTTNSGSFRSDNQGNIAIITALVATILFGVTGAAVDVGRWESLKSETSSALDAAVLAAGRALQIDGTSPDDAIRVAEQYYSLNGPSELPLDKVKFEFADNNSAIVATTDWTLPTTFMNLVGVRGLEVNLRSKAILNTRQPPGVNVEISMMLDTTGSMGWQGRMDELRLAATDLINIVLKDQRGTTKHGIRLAVAPFSSYVNVGRQFYETFTGEAPAGVGDSHTCVRERSSESQLYSLAPATNDERRFQPYNLSFVCPQRSVVVPLTNDKNRLLETIDNLSPSGMTAGHLGVAWAWYMLSPSFNRYWHWKHDAFPWSHLDQTTDVDMGGSKIELPKLRKIAILMTDGIFNTKYTGPNSDVQAKELCKRMKNLKVEVYTIGFQISEGTNAHDVMTSCASSESHYYDASNGDKLRMAFRDIAFRVSTLRLAE